MSGETDSTEKTEGSPGRRVPEWLRVKTGKGRLGRETRRLVAAHGLQTVCENARCPNMGECYSHQTATFLILGSTCTRNCGFCAVEHGTPGPPDPGEPERVARAARELGLKYVVVTSVTRDDLPDGGAAQFAATIRAVRAHLSSAKVEVLTPDFQGSREALELVLAAAPDVFNHNVETVRRLQATVRPQASYETSLGVLRNAADYGAVTKSGLMVGLGETREELAGALEDVAGAGVSILTLGQYLQPTRKHLDVERYVEPAEFEDLKRLGERAGIAYVFSGPFVRSSYHAAEAAACLQSPS